MKDFESAQSLAGLCGAGVFSIFLGVGIAQNGDRQSLLAGAGAIVAGIAIFVAIFAVEILKTRRKATKTAEAVAHARRRGAIWIGIILVLIPIPIYYYLSIAMPLFDPEKAMILLAVILLAGVGSICLGLITNGDW
jgi:hypothetical protein